jgi:lipopolysaccharide biosynthesis glycosyltransferase
MSKNALFCVCIYPEENKIPQEFNYALETFRLYCNKYNLNLIIVDKRKYTNGKEHNKEAVMLEKFQIYDYFGKYERILKIDLDVLITASCPNIFDVVPEDSVGVLYEDIGKRTKDRRDQIVTIKQRFGEIKGWSQGYFNAGVMVMSNIHKEANLLTADDISAFVNNEVGLLHEQNIINWKVRKLDYKIFPLEYKFNHMFMFDEVNFSNIKSGSLLLAKKNSYIVHYAGLRGKIRNRRMTRNYKKIIMDWNQQA